MTVGKYILQYFVKCCKFSESNFEGGNLGFSEFLTSEIAKNTIFYVLKRLKLRLWTIYCIQ